MLSLTETTSERTFPDSLRELSQLKIVAKDDNDPELSLFRRITDVALYQQIPLSEGISFKKSKKYLSIKGERGTSRQMDQKKLSPIVQGAYLE